MKYIKNVKKTKIEIFELEIETSQLPDSDRKRLLSTTTMDKCD